MEATSASLATVPCGSDGRRSWPLELKVKVVAETLIDGETVKAVAERYELIPSTVSDWRRMARQGRLVLPSQDGIDFVPVEIEVSVAVAKASPTTFSGSLDLIKGDVIVRLEATPAIRIARSYRPWLRDLAIP